MGRAAPLLALVAGLGVYAAVAERLPLLPTWADVAFLSIALLPATFALVWLALPVRMDLPPGRLPWALVGLVALTVLLHVAGLDVASNYAKFAAVTLAGWWFLGFFESVSWVLLVALLIVPVDIYSVAQGPTKVIVEEQPQVFDVLSVAFPIPGEGGAARLGLPDVLFFALFLAAAERFGLRPFWTWLAMVASFAVTMILAVAFDVAGLPALPLLSAGFLLANGDLLWRRWRAQPAAE